jgi:hypothetical protein
LFKPSAKVKESTSDVVLLSNNFCQGISEQDNLQLVPENSIPQCLVGAGRRIPNLK